MTPSNETLHASALDLALLKSMLNADAGVLQDALLVPLEVDSGILHGLNHDDAVEERIGLHRYRLIVKNEGEPDPPHEIVAVLKLKKSNDKLTRTGIFIAMMAGGPRLALLFSRQYAIFDTEQGHIRETHIYRDAPPALRQFLPLTHGVRIDAKNRLYALLMEDLSGCQLLNSWQPALWRRENIEWVLSDMAQMHAAYFDAPGALPPAWQVHALDKALNIHCTPMLRKLTRVNCSNFAWFNTSRLPAEMTAFMDRMGHNIDTMRAAPMTLTHNDLNPRNCCLRTDARQPDGGRTRLTLYDWELAQFQNPQRDLIEFLAYVFPDDGSADDFHHYTQFYRAELARCTERALPPEQFDEILRLNAVYFAVVRLNLYLMAHGLLKFDFLERICRNTERFVGDFLVQQLADGAHDVGGPRGEK